MSSLSAARLISFDLSSLTASVKSNSALHWRTFLMNNSVRSWEQRQCGRERPSPTRFVTTCCFSSHLSSCCDDSQSASQSVMKRTTHTHTHTHTRAHPHLGRCVLERRQLHELDRLEVPVSVSKTKNRSPENEWALVADEMMNGRRTR